MPPAGPQTTLAHLSLGRYQIHGQLGKGGMGVVYRGVDKESGRPVAIKTLAGISGPMLDGIRREIEALRALSHPGIVRVLDSGLSDGLPWYAMELIAGESLAGWMHSSRSHSLPAMTAFPAAATMTAGVRGVLLVEEEPGFGATMLAGFQPLLPEQPTIQDVRGYLVAAMDLEGSAGALLPLLNLVCLVCDALGYLHGEGLVHCDLKPQNVLVGIDGRPVLVDFGLTGRGARSRDVLDSADLMAGSVLYMAPEQVRGEQVDPRTDVYALGCILYEMVAGRPPFWGDSPQQVMMAHLTTAPASLVEVAQAPAMLDELVQSMLEKDPRDRVGHVDMVAATLRELGADVPGWVGAAPHRAYLYRPRTAGRTRELSEMQRWVVECRGVRSVVGVVDGVAGIGKTRVLTELASYARGKGFRLFACRSETQGERRSRVPFGTLRPFLLMLADYCQEIGESGTDRIVGEHGRWLVPYSPGLEEIPGQERYPAPEALSPEQSVSRVFGALKAILKTLSVDFPVALFFDDLQWADELTVAFLTHLATHPLEASVLVVGALRTENMAGLDILLRVPTLRRRTLGPLQPLEIETMVADMLAVESAPRSFVSVLSERSSGNPYLVAEYLHDAVSGNLLLRDRMGRWQVRLETDEGTARDFSRMPLPQSLRGLTEGRLRRLSDEAMSVVSAASVLGREVYPPWIEAMTGIGGSLLAQALRELRQFHVLEEAGPWLQFIHETMRQATYERLGAEGQAALHGRAGMVLEDALRQHALDRAMIAEHFLRAGMTERARGHLLHAARQARRGFALEEADRLYVQYLSLSPELTLERYIARQEFAREVLFQRRDNRRALEQLELFAAEAEQLGDERALGDALRLSGVTHRLLGDVTEARKRFERSLALMERLGEAAGVSKVLNSLGNLYGDAGEHERARVAFERALQITRQLGNARDEALFLGNLGLCYNQLGQLDEGVRCLEAALAVHRSRGDLDGESMAATNLAGTHWLRGKLASSRRAFVEVLALNERVQNLRHQSVTMDALGVLSAESGQLAQGEEYLAKAMALSVTNGHIIGELNARLNWVDVAIYRGELDVARAQLAVVGERLGQADLPLHRARHVVGEGHLALVAGRPEAVSLLRDAVARMDGLDAPDEGARAQVMLAEALLRAGLVDESQAHLEAALDVFEGLPYAHDRLRALIAASRIHRWSGGRLERCERILTMAGAPLPEEDPLGLAQLYFELGHLDMMRGLRPELTISQTPPLLVGAEPGTHHGWVVGRRRFERALAAVAQGVPLWRGEGVREGDRVGLW